MTKGRATVARMFCRYALRTTDLPAARAFYADALGLSLPDGMDERSALEAFPLHERARAAGAPPHWLGLLAVTDVDAAVQRIASGGGQPLAPKMQAQDGASFATVRDPFGSVVGVRDRKASASDPQVVWHQLNTRDANGACALYGELTGWSRKETFEVPNLEGGYRTFAWQQAGEPVGAVANTARWPSVHTHWLFFFPVSDALRSAERVRACGGTALPPITLPTGLTLVSCEDPQGAAFGLAQRA